ncbi:hypothetical protein DICPUDRAFT_158631 [Dictyostelium purpureum]|uniref:Uncharacterized protein n=1 Tax=Dictyostelium purpureum TaxID=5786 RepID=F1A238_DICPU|nr:uncharacterized protein DICPUDRAFT_158631 [Dictyostelium purpureum]EGC29737.1 hypothetical protein DICPUDRAFT_158631 [Dictyostelium purpureum]|eukprot:XP_003293730.1 hypothetical protein DICPUDRAFT_158631 [Dictyostelium purpureum]
MSILRSITSISKTSNNLNSNSNSLVNKVASGYPLSNSDQSINENQYWLSKKPTVTFISIYNIFRIPAYV